MSFYQILTRRAQGQADSVAYQFLSGEGGQPEAISYHSLLQAVDQVVAATHDKIMAGDRVVITMPSCKEFVVAFLACQALGAVAVPAPPPGRKRINERLLGIVEDCAPRAIFVVSGDGTANGASAEDDGGDQLKDCELFEIDRLIGETSVTPENLAREVATDDIAFLQYTSGSTGVPKGVAVTHGNLHHNTEIIVSQLDRSIDNVGLSWLPMFHDMGLVGGMLCPLQLGFPVTIMPPAMFLMRPVMWLELIGRLGVTVTVCPNFALDLCAEKVTPEALENLDLSSLTMMLCGAEPIQAETLARFSRVFEPAGFNPDALSPAYGLAETTLMVSCTPARTPHTANQFSAEALSVVGQVGAASVLAEARSGSTTVVGCGELQLDVAVVHPDHRRRLQANTIGEIWVTGDSVAKGYWQRPDLSRQVFENRLVDDEDQRSYLATGDLGFVAEGQLYVTGRIKDVIIIRGRNYYPQDIERAGSRVSDVLATGVAAAFTATIDDADRLVVLLEATRTGLKQIASQPAAEALIRDINRAVATEVGASPDVVCLLKPRRILRTSSGKIRRSANRDAWLADELDVVFRWDNPASAGRQQVRVSDETDAGLALPPLIEQRDIENWIVGQIAERSGMDTSVISLDQPFVSFGLDSLAAVQLVEALQSRLPADKEIDPTLLWNYPTIESLVAYICSDETGQAHRQSVAADDQQAEFSDTSETTLEDEVEKLKSLLQI